MVKKKCNFLFKNPGFYGEAKCAIAEAITGVGPDANNWKTIFEIRRLKGSFHKLICWSLVILLTSLLVSCSNQSSVSKPGMILSGDTPWIVDQEQPEPVQRALEDVKSDWYKVFGRLPVVLKELPASWKGPVIYMGLKGSWKSSLVRDPFPGAECFILRLQQDNGGRTALVATGADIRGSIYAAYTLSEEILGVDPWYYWVDKEPIKQNRIEIAEGFDKHYGPATFKYRGWFINDEDLLNGFSPDPLKENVFSIEMFDHIYETILRLRGNMVVPSTFPFPDERCQELAARRGLILNMHHILVLGLNTYRWPKDVPFSYSKHSEVMEHYWQTCIEAFKDYEVVWTTGYRGKHDRPFWRDEPELATPEARGDVITKAIAKQVDMLHKVHPDAAIISNLWMEGAELYQNGHIRLPESVTLVWPDNGAGIIQDKGNVKARQGIYYHTAMMSGRANQLSEMVNPARIYREVGRFIEAGATEFFLVNVSDIRPVPLSTDCVMRLVWDAKPYIGKSDKQNMEDFLQNWSQRQFGSDIAAKVAALYNQYFDISYMRDDVLEGEHSLMRRFSSLYGKCEPKVEKGELLNDELLKQCREFLDFSSSNLAYLYDLSNRADALVKQIPPDRRDFYSGHLITQVQIHLQLLKILEVYCKSMLAYNSADKSPAIKFADEAIQASDDLSVILHKAEYGKWVGWYKGESFLSLSSQYDNLRVLAAQFRGEPLPPVRIKRVTYEEIEEYQVPFTNNFPLLYPKK